MKDTIYLVVCNGNRQTLWFGSLEKAREYCKEYAPDSYQIHKYQYAEKVEEVKPKPLYKEFW